MEDSAAIWIIFTVILVIIILGGSIFTETIGTLTLDKVCQNITNNPNAKYYQEVGWQLQFPCKVNNQIIIVNAEALELEGDTS